MKLQIVLDLDGTLISSVPIGRITDPEIVSVLATRPHVFTTGSFVCFVRPGVRKLLRTLQQIGEFGVWTAASLSYGQSVCTRLFSDAPAKFYLSGAVICHENPSGPTSPDPDPGAGGALVASAEQAPSQGAANPARLCKPLDYIYQNYRFDKERTLIVDDQSSVCRREPRNSIQVKPWNYQEQRDRTLYRLADYLKKLSQHPPGTDLRLVQHPSFCSATRLSRWPD